VSEPLGYLLSQTFHIDAATLVTDDDRGGGPTTRTLTAGWYRTFLAPSGGAGTESDPAELLHAVETALDGSRWHVRLTSEGLVRITYVGMSSGTLAIGSADLANLLGHTGGAMTLASGAHHDGEYPPTHCLFAAYCDPDSGWIDQPSRFAGSALPGGVVYGWHDGRCEMKRSATLSALPKTWAMRTALGASGSPVFPTAARMGSPSTGEPGQDPPWSCLDFAATSAGRQLAVTWGELQELLTGDVTTYDVVYAAPEQYSSGQRVSLWKQGYDARRSYALELLFAGEGSL
jgi:hypothetical protein